MATSAQPGRAVLPLDPSTRRPLPKFSAIELRALSLSIACLELTPSPDDWPVAGIGEIGEADPWRFQVLRVALGQQPCAVVRRHAEDPVRGSVEAFLRRGQTGDLAGVMRDFGENPLLIAGTTERVTEWLNLLRIAPIQRPGHSLDGCLAVFSLACSLRSFQIVTKLLDPSYTPAPSFQKLLSLPSAAIGRPDSFAGLIDKVVVIESFNDARLLLLRFAIPRSARIILPPELFECQRALSGACV